MVNLKIWLNALSFLSHILLSRTESFWNENVRVAFIFAGGVRTFVLPEIYESIRYNLINSFCPPMNCAADVFVRLSIDDNWHVGANAVGKKIKGDKKILKDVAHAVARIAHASPKSKLFWRVVNIGSNQEANEMDKVTATDFKQKVYRDLDPRRYSMYFNRAAAYDMALREEIINGKNYTWVVHARLDAGWGAPIRPFHMWSMGKVWVPDSWYADVPDTFALLPRNRSDIFFSLTMQYKPNKVMCVGGTNFDPKTMKDAALAARGYSPVQIQKAQAEDCFAKFSKNGAHPFIVTYEKHLNITWTSAGTSEVLLKRKLKHYGVSLKANTLGFTSLFMFVARYPLQFLCFWIEPGYFIPWVKDVQPCSDPIGTGCVAMMKTMSYAQEVTQAQACDVQAMASRYPLSVAPRSTCTLDKKMTDWNFMPFRIRSKGRNVENGSGKGSTRTSSRVGTGTVAGAGAGAGGGESQCLTGYGGTASSPSHLMMAACVDARVGHDSYMHDYLDAQLVSLLPLSPAPQRLINKNFSIEGEGLKCLHVRERSDPQGPANAASTATPASSLMVKKLGVKDVARLYVVQFDACSMNELDVAQLFTVHLVSPSTGGGGGGGGVPYQSVLIPHTADSTFDAVRTVAAAATAGERPSEASASMSTSAGTTNVVVARRDEKLGQDFAPLLPQRVFAAIEWVGQRQHRLCLSLGEGEGSGWSGEVALTPCHNATPSVEQQQVKHNGSGLGGSISPSAVLVLERSLNKSPIH